MAKKILKRSLALGALMAFVITGSAMAAQNLVSGGDAIGVGDYVVTTDVEISGSQKPMMGYQNLGNPGASGFVKVNVNDGKMLTVISNNGATGVDTTGAVSNVIITGNGIIDIQGKGNASGLGYGAINEIVAQSINISSDNAWGVYTGGNTEKQTLSADTITISGAKHTVYSAKGNITIKDFNLLTVNGNNDAGGLVSNEDGTIDVTGSKAVIKGTANSALAALSGSTLNVTVEKLEATANGLGTETGPARKQGAIAADGNSFINLNVKDSLTVDVKESASGKDVYGIIAGKNGKGPGTVNINANTNDNNTAVIKINVSGDDATGIFARKSDNRSEVSSVVINGKSLTINANVNEDCTIDNSKAGYGVWVANGTSNNSTNITNVTINTASTTINAKTGLVNFSEGKLDITNDLTVNSTIALETRGDAVTNINADGNGTVKMTGDIVFGYATNSGTGINADVNITLSNEESYLNGDIYKDTTSLPDGALVRDKTLDDVSKMKLTINKGIWTPDGEVDSFVNTLDINDGVLNIKDGNDKKVEVGTADGGEGWKGSGTVNFENPDNAVAGQVVVIKDQNAKITVATSSDKLGDNIEAGLEKLATFVVNKDATGSTAADFAKGTAGSMYDEVVAEVNTDGTIGEVKKTIAAANVSVNDMAAIGLMSWRAEMNDMNKRMGELRNANGEYGVWVRMVRGEAEYNSVKNQYNQYQLGYDEKLSIDKRWNVGVALSYTDAENTFAQGNGESTNKSLSIYGSKLNNDGTFIDLIAKYARLENEFTTVSGMGDAEYDTNGYSVSAEFGKRIQQGNGLWIEPQVELTYGKVGSADYVTKNGVKVVQDSMDSIIGRVGFSLGKDVKDGNVYARASYLYDFDGETNAVLNGVETLENNLGGGWWEVGFGANVNLSKATYIYADIEKTFGGEVDTNWQWNLGVRYSF